MNWDKEKFYLDTIYITDESSFVHDIFYAYAD